MARNCEVPDIPLSLIGNYPSQWDVTTLEKACALVTDGTHDSPKESFTGFPLVTGRCITGGRLNLSAAYLISESDHREVIARSKPEFGDILFANIGNSIGELARIETKTEFSIKNLALLKPGSKLDSQFLKFYLLSPPVQDFIRGNTFGSAQPFIGLGTLRAFPIPLPPLPEQKRIASILGALDDKIELNRRMNATLEAMAQALFKSWFVDFDPVRAKLDGRKPEGMDEATADMFPAYLQDSEVGLIPQGWQVKTLGEVIELAYGKPLKAEDRKNGAFWVYGANGPVGRHNEKLVNGPGIVVGRKGNPGVVTWSHGDFYPIDTTFYVEPKGECRSLFFLYYALSLQNLANLTADSAVPGLNRNHAYMSKQVIPSLSVIDAFDSNILPIFSESTPTKKTLAHSPSCGTPCCRSCYRESFL